MIMIEITKYDLNFTYKTAILFQIEFGSNLLKLQKILF